MYQNVKHDRPVGGVARKSRQGERKNLREDGVSGVLWGFIVLRPLSKVNLQINLNQIESVPRGFPPSLRTPSDSFEPNRKLPETAAGANLGNPCYPTIFATPQ